MTMTGTPGRRIALVSDRFEVGGVETATLAVGRLLAGAGYRPHVVTTRAPGAWFDHAFRQGLGATFVAPGHATGARAAHEHVRRVADHLSRFDAVLLAHAHDAQAGVGLLPPSMPVVSVLHCDVDEVYDVGLANAQALSAVVAVSGPIAERARERVGSRAPVVCIPNFTDVPEEVPVRLDTGNGIELLFVGRLVPHKGTRHLVHVLARLRADGVDARLTVVGDGPERRRLEEETAAARLQGTVTFRGFVPPEAARAAMREADVLLLPSSSEGLPLVVVEAMAEGLVPVVSRLPVMRDVVTDDVDALTFDVGDEAAMVAALRSLAEPNRRAGLGRAAHATARRRFSVEVCGPRWVRLFDDAFADHRGHGRSRRPGWPIHPGPLVPWSEVVPKPLRDLVRPWRRGRR